MIHKQDYSRIIPACIDFNVLHLVFVDNVHYAGWIKVFFEGGKVVVVVVFLYSTKYSVCVLFSAIDVFNIKMS